MCVFTPYLGFDSCVWPSVGSFIALFLPFAVSAVGCGGGDQSEQVATDEELAAYGQAAAPQEWKEAINAVNQVAKGEEGIVANTEPSFSTESFESHGVGVDTVDTSSNKQSELYYSPDGS